MTIGDCNCLSEKEKKMLTEGLGAYIDSTRNLLQRIKSDETYLGLATTDIQERLERDLPEYEKLRDIILFFKKCDQV